MEEKNKKNIFQRHPILTFGVGVGIIYGACLKGVFTLSAWASKQLEENYNDAEEEYQELMEKREK